MRKIIIPIVILFILSLSSVFAQYSPLPINGQIYADNPDGLTVRVTNLRSGISMESTVNGAGQYLIEWANAPDTGIKYKINDIFKVEILECSDSVCSQTITYTGQPELFLTFDLFDVNIITTTIPAPIITTTISCPECQFTSCSSCCPDCPTTLPCEECPTTIPKECDSCCPEQPVWYSTIEFFITLIIAFGGGIGIKIGVDKYGKPSIKITQHKHANYTAYHSINTVHTKEPHPKGCIYPIYENGKFIRCGD